MDPVWSPMIHSWKIWRKALILTISVFGSGHYLYIEASAPRTPGQKARVITPTYPQTTGVCVEFYYHMYGTGMGQLILHTKAKGVITGDIWTMGGNQGNTWNLAQATVQSSTPYQVSFCTALFLVSART